MENRKRNIQMKFYVTEEEKRLAMEKKQAYANLRNCVRNNLTGL